MSEGARRVLELPLRGGYAELGAALTTARGPEAWGEVGHRPGKGTALFGRAYARPGGAGLFGGVRWEW
jgi:hypothetical protein